MGILNVLFLAILVAGIGFFVNNVRKLVRNIKLGRDVERTDRKAERWKNMGLIAIGQRKMVRRPLSGFFHIIVYISFCLMNIEMLEIIIDGIFGTHRFFQDYLGGFYGVIIGTFEILAVCVLVSVTVFWLRRNIERVKRFWNKEMDGWAKRDGNIILYFEVVLMSLFLTMNATDYAFQESGAGNVISRFIYPFYENYSQHTLHVIEQTAWWLHIIGILIFLNYLYYSKHLHILLAFPNTFFANLEPNGKFNNLEAVTNEVKMMMDPNADPFAAGPESGAEEEVPEKFGASDVADLNWVQLMNAYTCTECGRCTSSCPANLTGKELSPRAIMMKTRDRLEEVGRNIDANGGEFVDDGKQLLDDYISREELWACTTCNACVVECPVNISPLSIIMDMRQYLVMEESAAPQELNAMMTNVENNGAMWQYSQMDRLNWKDEE